MQKSNVQRWTKVAMLAAIYTALSLALAPLSFANLQVRVAEALTVLAILNPIAIYGVTLGCFITNLFGVLMGVNPLGFLDVVVGTLATLIAGLLSYRLRFVRLKGFPLVSFLMPVLVNALMIGAELTWVFAPAFTLSYFAIFAAEVGLGQAIAVFGFGWPLYRLFLKHPTLLSV
jgi:uncharacterized membrane protein